MSTLNVFNHFNKHGLVTRESARSLRVPLINALAAAPGELVLDFRGIQAVTPSFLDELLRVVRDAIQAVDPRPRVILTNVPARLSPGFTAIGRSRGTSIRQTTPDASSTTWEIQDFSVA